MCFLNVLNDHKFLWSPADHNKKNLELKMMYKTALWYENSPGTPVSSTNKTDSHDITEILLKVVLNTITLIWRFNFVPINDTVSIRFKYW